MSSGGEIEVCCEGCSQPSVESVCSACWDEGVRPHWIERRDTDSTREDDGV